MRYGFCKEFSTPLKTEVDYDLIKMIKEAGFDYVEMRAMLVSSLTDEEFDKLYNTLKELNLDCDCCCALFPKTIRVTGKSVNLSEIEAYLEKTFARCKKLGAKKIVFGSAPARALDEETSQDEGYKQIADVIKKTVVPMCEKYDMMVVMEPLRNDACNFINTLSDGMRVVNDVKSDKIQLLADTIHMMTNNDNPDDVLKYKDSLKHIHIAELQRIMPEDEYSDFINTVLKNLRQNGYDGTVSFESKNGNGVESMKKALNLLKNNLY
ncbi:MAG: sugar phosphate isomerase/epimerase [Ruminococcaceae bacterium]|nr:sugar phosphate isomerase/epimerase [Oscillospiraceae bacterium]